MKSKKGFTLIELLAVIVILAIIALIATPIVLNLINKARQGAAKDSAYGVRKAGELYYQAVLLKDPSTSADSVSVSFDDGVVTVTPAVEGINFELDGKKPESGVITISDKGEVDGAVVVSGYLCSIPKSGEVICSSNSDGKFSATEIVYNLNGTDQTVQYVLEDLYTKLDY